MSGVVVVGSLNMDVMARVPHHPALGETVLGTDLRFAPGGKGANQAVAATRLGASTAMVGRVGADAFGDSLLQFLADLDRAGLCLGAGDVVVAQLEIPLPVGPVAIVGPR